MGILGKVAFWKRKDELGLGDNSMPQLPPDIGGIPSDELMPQFPQQQTFTQQQPMESFGKQQNFRQDRDMELIAARLDAINSKLQSIEQRIAGLERVAYGEQTAPRYRRW